MIAEAFGVRCLGTALKAAASRRTPKIRNVHPAYARIAVRPVVIDSDDHERVVGTELTKTGAEGSEVGAVVGLHDEGGFERQVAQWLRAARDSRRRASCCGESSENRVTS